MREVAGMTNDDGGHAGDVYLMNMLDNASTCVPLNALRLSSVLA
jgi:hypothetical protein